MKWSWSGRQGARSIQPKFPEISVQNSMDRSVRSNRKSFEKTGPPFEVDHFFRLDRLEFWLNGSRPGYSAVRYAGYKSTASNLSIIGGELSSEKISLS